MRHPAKCDPCPVEGVLILGSSLRVSLSFGASDRGPYISLFDGFKHHLFGP